MHLDVSNERKMTITAIFLPLGSELLKCATDREGKGERMIRFGRQKLRVLVWALPKTVSER